jgi:N-acetylglutamate synthase-like GNAT family acetyltransferase
MTVRKARNEDVPAMLLLMEPHVSSETLLPREEQEVRQRLDEFLLIEDSSQDGRGKPHEAENGERLLGLVALHHYGSGLAEVRSLAVAESHAGNGLGRRLVMGLIDKARTEHLTRLIALTRTPAFFERLGFSQTPVDGLPEKVQRDCQFCPRRERCDEVAMFLDLGDSPE